MYLFIFVYLVVATVFSAWSVIDLQSQANKMKAEVGVVGPAVQGTLTRMKYARWYMMFCTLAFGGSLFIVIAETVAG